MNPNDAPARGTWFRDALERTLATFVEGFAGTLILGGKLDVSTAEAAALGGLMAALSVVKSVAAAFVGGRSASLDPGLATVEAGDPFAR